MNGLKYYIQIRQFAQMARPAQYSRPKSDTRTQYSKPNSDTRTQYSRPPAASRAPKGKMSDERISNI